MIPIYIGLSREVLSRIRGLEDKTSVGIKDIVRVMEDVRKSGDAAIHHYNRLYYNIDTRSTGLFITREDYSEAYDRLSSEYIDSLKEIIKRVRNIERKRLSSLIFSASPSSQIQVAYMVKPLNKVGIYLPSNSPLLAVASLTPATVAGVKDIIVGIPPSYYGGIHPGILVALDILGIHKVFRSCGPAAIAAFAYGTKSINRVEKILGIGKDVSTALRMVADVVETQALRLPQKLVILTDKTGDAEAILWDIYSWVENRPDPQAIIVSVDRALAESVASLNEEMRNNPFVKNISGILDMRTAIVIARDWDEAISIVNRLSPDFLEIMAERDVQYRLLDYLRNASTISIGRYSPPSYVEYFGGITSLSRYGIADAMSVQDYVRISRVVRVDPDALINDYETMQAVYDTESMPGHYFAVKKRLDNL